MIKTQEQVEIMKEGGKILRKVYGEVKKLFVPGVETNKIDSRCKELILDLGGEISFETVSGYHWSSCICINEQIVHTPPSDRKLIEGDLLTFDFGVLYKGFHVDFADTVIVGEGQDENKIAFLHAGKVALEKAIEKVYEGNTLFNISKTIFKEITDRGYVVIKGLTGHGIGRLLHEKPFIPGYPTHDEESKIVLQKNMTFAIEVIYSEKSDRFIHEDDWSLITADGSLSACFEHTVLVDKKPRILT